MPVPRDKPYSCTIWTHNDAFSKEPVLFNRSSVANGAIPADCLISLVHAQRNGQGNQRGSASQPFVFRASDLPQDLKGSANFQLSIHEKVAKLYGFARRLPVVLSVVEPQLHSASHVELSYRDVQLDRSDMWRLCSLKLHGRSLFQGQTITFLGSINVTVKSIYVRGHKVLSGVFTDSSRPVFRSETARYIILIQMSKEMWDFDLEASGETLWSKCIDGFLPQLFEKWAGVNARHLLTVVLFTRLQYNRGRSDAHCKDYYRVVASEVPSTDSVVLLQRIRTEYINFLRDVETQQSVDGFAEVVNGIPSTAAQGNFLEAVNLATSHLARESNDVDLLRTESSIIVVSPGVALMEADRDILRLTTERAISSGFAVDLVCLAQQPLHAVPLFKTRRSSLSKSAPTVTPAAITAGPAAPSYAPLSSSPTKMNSTISTSFESKDGTLNSTSWSFIRPSWVVTTFYSKKDATRKSKSTRKAMMFSYLPTCRMYQMQSVGISQNEKHLTIPRIQSTSNARNTAIDFPALAQAHDDEMFSREKEGLALNATSSSRATTASQDTVSAIDANVPQRTLSPKGISPVAYEDATLAPLRKPSPQRSMSTQVVSQLKRNSSPAPSVSSLVSKKSMGFLKLNKRLGKSSVTTSATVESAEPAYAHFKHTSTDGKMTFGKDSISRQFKMSLSRSASATSSSQLTAPSQPIPIAPSPMLVPADKGKPEEVGSVASTPKPWSLDRDDAFKAATSLKRSGGSWEQRYLASKASATPREDMSPWLIDMTPADATPRNHDTFAGWKHVFVPTAAMSAIKWTTLSCPATLPLTTESVPPVDILRSPAYTESPYIVSIDETDDQQRTATMLELVTRRISKGFQLGVGPRASELTGVTNADNRIFSHEFARDSSASVVMVRGNTVHLLSGVDNGVAVIRFQRRHTSRGAGGIKYEPKISTIMDKRYSNRVFHISTPPEENWNAIDNFIVGQHTLNPLTSSLGAATIHRIRFVLLPVEVPGPRKIVAQAEDTDEELRIEGIRKLTMLWQGVKSFQRDSHKLGAVGPSRAELSPLAIEYQTHDPSFVVTQGLENSPLIDGNLTVTSARLFQDSEAYKTSKVDLHKLASDLQGPKGIKMRDRRWHLKMHHFCFEGVELTSFLLANFKDLDSRDAAIDFGNVLMGRGLFEHVQSKHRFRDGNFFYSLSSEYRAQRPESKGWFSGRRADIASPLTIAADSKKMFSPALRPVEDHPRRITLSESGRPRVTLSSSITFDVDPGPRRKSNRPELVTLHYDRLHNPEAAFHILLEWENTTSKLVEEHVASWSIAVEKHGLKLVQAPLAEIGAIGRANPFRTPYIVKLAIAPPKNYVQKQQQPDDAAPDVQPLPPTEKYKHMKIILRKNGYVLDYEGAFRFPATVDVRYSWGDSMYSRDQYIHKSGRVIAQIVDDETLILMVNRLSTSRNNPAKYDKESLRPGTGAQVKPIPLETLSSPLTGPVWQQSTFQPPATQTQKVQGPLSPNLREHKEQIEHDCHDRSFLCSLYDDLANQLGVGGNATLTTPSGRAAAPGQRTPSLEGSIPSLELAPLDDVDPLSLNAEGGAPGERGQGGAGNGEGGGNGHVHLDTVVEVNEP